MSKAGHRRTLLDAITVTSLQCAMAIVFYRFSEGSALLIFVLLVLLWFFRSPEFIPGWSSAFREGYVSDSTPALFLAFLFFIIPNRLPCQPSNAEDFAEKIEPILSWKVISKKFPWDVVLLLGGALALADGVIVRRSKYVFRSF